MSELFMLLPLLSSTSVTAIQTVFVALLVFAGQYAVAKMSHRAQGKTTEVDAQSKATEAWQKYAEEMRGRLDNLESRVSVAEKRVQALEFQTVRDLDLLRRVYWRFLHLIDVIRDHNLAKYVRHEDDELVELVRHRLASDPLPKE